MRAAWDAQWPYSCENIGFVLSVYVEPPGATVPVTTTMNFDGTDFVVPPFTGYYAIECSTGPCIPGHGYYGLTADFYNDVAETNEENNGDYHLHLFGPPCTPTATVTPSPEPSATPTACTLSFSDVLPEDPFYSNIRCLACRGILSGYADGTFRPFNEITRGQIAKVLSNAAGINDDEGDQIYEDVDAGNSFYVWINRLSRRGYMGGYPCGGTGEPCGADNKPYFRPFNNASRGQLTKIVANTAGWDDDIPPDRQTFAGVPPGNPFWIYVERVVLHSQAIGGYPCGGEGEPCDDQQRPYFRPYNNVTRGQASKIIANVFFPNCQTPWRLRW